MGMLRHYLLLESVTQTLHESVRTEDVYCENLCKVLDDLHSSEPSLCTSQVPQLELDSLTLIWFGLR